MTYDVIKNQGSVTCRSHLPTGRWHNMMTNRLVLFWSLLFGMQFRPKHATGQIKQFTQSQSLFWDTASRLRCTTILDLRVNEENKWFSTMRTQVTLSLGFVTLGNQFLGGVLLTSCVSIITQTLISAAPQILGSCSELALIWSTS